MRHALVVALSSLAAAASLHAGTATDFKKSVIEPEPEKGIARTQVSIGSTYVADGGFKRGAGKLGSVDELNSKFLATYRFCLSEHWYFKVGAKYDRFDFGTSDAPLDTTFQSAAAVIGLEYVVNGKVGLLLKAYPGVYFTDDVDSDAFNVPVDFAFAQSLSGESLYLILGFSYSAFREYPVIPLVGLLWNINSQWTLEAYLPEPRLVYQPNDRLSLWAGAEFAGGSFRTSERNVTPKKLSGALVTYSEVRAGLGMSYVVCPGFTVDAAAGYAVAREFNYHRAGEVYGVESAPYVQFAGRMEF